MFFVIGAGILISLFALWTCLSVPDVGFFIWIVLMAIFWIGIPTIGTKYYESNFSEERHKKHMLRYYHQHQIPYCTNCISASRRWLWFKSDTKARTKIEVCQCKDCGSYYVDFVDCTPGSTKLPDVKIITEEEAMAYCQRKDGIRSSKWN